VLASLANTARSRVVQLWIFFGQSGAGKSFVARVCAEEFGFEFYDGDLDLTPAMRAALSAQRVFTSEMRAEFVAVLVRRIRERSSGLEHSQAPRLAVSQGLFKTRDRERLQSQLPTARLIWVRASEALIEVRLLRRTEHVASREYARLVNSGFEPPGPNEPSDVLDNDGDRARVVQHLCRLRAAAFSVTVVR
jgi:gluconokinase